MKKFELSLTSNYAKSWGLQEALRELIQNAIDQEVQMDGNTMDINYDGENVLRISNKSSCLSKKSLLLGHTSKENDENTIGQFGEGLKIALLVLNRLGKKVTIYNYGNREVWTSKFVKSRRYEGEEVLTIFVDTEAIWKKTPDSNLTVQIEDISSNDYSELVDRTIQLNKNVGETLNTGFYGTILLDEKFKGKIFINGLYVNTIKELTYGYDIKPNFLTIGRDRDLVSTFDIIYTTSSMWSEHNNELLQELIKNNSKDVGYLRTIIEDSISNQYNEIRDVTYEGFKSEHGDNSIPVSSQTEYDNVSEMYDNANIIIVNETQKEIIVNSHEYKKNIAKTVSKKTLSKAQKVAIWKSKYGKYLPNAGLKELDEILNLKELDKENVI